VVGGGVVDLCFIGSVGGLFELEMEMECFLGCGFHLNLAPILS
jgi:hypothetical protein